MKAILVCLVSVLSLNVFAQERYCGRLIADDSLYLPKEEPATYGIHTFDRCPSDTRCAGEFLSLMIEGQATVVNGHVPELLAINNKRVCVTGRIPKGERLIIVKDLGAIEVQE